jgi:protein-S-isoprenylcysteine O-methyltransferase Ste14
MPHATTTQPNEPTIRRGCGSPLARWIPGPPALLLSAVVSMAALHLALPLAPLPLATLRLFACAPAALVAGLALNLSADRAFRNAGTTVKPLLESTALVTDGVFGWTRNPMYLGFVFLLAGLWLFLGSLSPALIVFAFGPLVDRLYVRPEEARLGRAFTGYAAYRARVRRWL